MIWLEKIELLGWRFCDAMGNGLDGYMKGIGDLAKVIHEGWKGQVADTPRGARFRINGFPHTPMATPGASAPTSTCASIQSSHCTSLCYL